MNKGQEQFFNFIMERVRDGKREVAEELLNESFGKQADGTFEQEYLQSFIPRMTAVLKPEFIDEVNKIMTQFSDFKK